MTDLVLLRHGQSVWNRRLRFTGWSQVPLSLQGRAEVAAAGRLLRERGFVFDVCFTSWLERAADSAAIMLEAMDLAIGIESSWRLNERHYGRLQGHTVAGALWHYGLRTVWAAKHEFGATPPAVDTSDARFPGNDALYSAIPAGILPRAESMADALERLMPYWDAEIAPAIRCKERVLIVSHGNLLRALIKFLEDLPAVAVARCKIPTGEPLIYQLDERLRPVTRHFASKRGVVRW